MEKCEDGNVSAIKLYGEWVDGKKGGGSGGELGKVIIVDDVGVGDGGSAVDGDGGDRAEDCSAGEEGR